LLGTNLRPEFTNRSPTDRFPRLAATARAEVELGFCPATDLEQGLRRCIDYYTARPGELQEPEPPESPLGQGPHFFRLDADVTSPAEAAGWGETEDGGDV